MCTSIPKEKKKRKSFYLTYLSDISFDSKLGMFRDAWNEQATNAAAGFLGQ